ncbi:glutaredoxin 3 [Loktanella ponticola]|uniref:Glutaredoxin n=1 Tax=Yoonia ponticola TaxID=1524255 RepID=A0A7W9BIT8_9RHOB|nr:glutaredoxin 3 [Yoonia ponticola]MBB5721347.1 glutaredoxin 3 [Yoonia ponticola]
MATIEMYMKPTCGFCHAAARMLDSKKASYATINILAQPAKRAEMIQRAKGGSTVPQIFIDGKHIGGYDDLNALNARGKLDALLKA